MGRAKVDSGEAVDTSRSLGRRSRKSSPEDNNTILDIHQTQSYRPPTMACERASKPLLQCLRNTTKSLSGVQLQARGFQSSASVGEGQSEPSQPFYKAPDPSLVSSPRLERRLIRQGTSPIGSRRRRAALQGSANLPFEQLPYQCFQEARKILLSDRTQKLEEIETMRQRIARVEALSPEEAGSEKSRKSRVHAMQLHLERLKINADINDPLVKRKFEDGQGTLEVCLLWSDRN